MIMTARDQEYEDYRHYFGEGMHTAFRKASDHPSAFLIHRLITELPDEEWSAIVDFVAREVWEYPRKDHRSLEKGTVIIRVTPAQVLAAKLSIELAEEDGRVPDEAILAIANAEVE